MQDYRVFFTEQAPRQRGKWELLDRRFGTAHAEAVRRFHRSIPGYAPTPLAELKARAAALGLGALYIKDESRRFDLNAFKVLGGSYAIACLLAERLGTDPGSADWKFFLDPETRKRLGDLTFVTATDGNHGRGVAWTAARLGFDSVVYMPRGTAAERLDNIRALGSRAEITPLLYDDAVRKARQDAEKYGWLLVQDTSWEGYEKVPARIMEGYTTMALEAAEQMKEPPTHILLQAGVGAMAGAMAAFFTLRYPEAAPRIVILEPHAADCLYQTAAARDGRLHTASGALDSMMAGLCCGEVCPPAWEILKDCASAFVTVPEDCAVRGMRLLGRPLPGDPAVISGESGASTAGLIAALMALPELEETRKRLELNGDSRVLCFSTEGATDRENYRKILGEAPSEPSPEQESMR